MKRNALIKEMNDFGVGEAKKKKENEFNEAVSNSSMFVKANVIQSLASKYKEYNRVSIEDAVDKVMNNGIETESDITIAALDVLRKGSGLMLAPFSM